MKIEKGKWYEALMDINAVPNGKFTKGETYVCHSNGYLTTDEGTLWKVDLNPGIYIVDGVVSEDKLPEFFKVLEDYKYPNYPYND